MNRDLTVVVGQFVRKAGFRWVERLVTPRYADRIMLNVLSGSCEKRVIRTWGITSYCCKTSLFPGRELEDAACPGTCPVPDIPPLPDAETALRLVPSQLTSPGRQQE